MADDLKLRFRIATLVAVLLWTAGLATSLSWNAWLHRWTTLQIARSQAVAAFDKDLAYRAWNRDLGGIYIPADRTEPEATGSGHATATTGDGAPLVRIGPTRMTRMLHEIEGQESGVVGRIASRAPLRSENAADPWETRALRAFDSGVVEVYGVHQRPTGEVLRFMRPLRVEPDCVDCRIGRGYQVGEIQGSIGSSVPLAPIRAIVAPLQRFTLIGHVLVWLIGLGLIAAIRRATWTLMASLKEARQVSEIARLAAEDANAAKSRFLASMSHELRTPLNAILGFAQMLKDDVLGQGVSDRYRGYAGDVHASGEHLLRVINQVLDISRIEAGKVDLSIEQVDVADQLGRCARLVAPEADERGVTVVCQVPEGLRLGCDRLALRQIAINLLSNAVRHTPAGGRVDVAAARIGNLTRLTFSDTGSGIPAEDLPRLLRPFERADNAYISQSGGTGLGLPLVDALVRMHGGTLAIESAAGTGTRVTIDLP